MELRPWGPYGQQAVFPARELVGVTRPVFGVMEPSRQRRAVSEVRCQVCFAELAPISESLGASSTVHWLTDRLHEPRTMRGHQLVLEPWVCDECLEYVLQVCPGMIRRAGRAEPPADPDLLRYRVLAVFSANLIAVTGRIGGSGDLAGAVAVTYCKIEPLTYRRLSASTVLEHGAAAVRRMLETEGPPGVPTRV